MTLINLKHAEIGLLLDLYWVKNHCMSYSRRYPLIFNPRARSQKGGRTRQFLMDHANRFALYATNSGAEAIELAKKFANEGEPIVIAAGGDGTLNAVVSGLAGSETALGIMPAGTMNVFARELGIHPNSLPKALEVIEHGLTREIDLFSANGAPFVQMAGIGFDAMVIEETKWENKKLFGPMAYVLAAIKVLGQKPPQIEVIRANGHKDTGVAMLCGNGSLYGGQFRLFRNANNNDSMLDVIIFKESGYRFLIDSFQGLVKGGIDLAEHTICFQSESITIKSDSEVPVEIDGEWLGRFREITFCEMHSRLKVLAPEKVSGLTLADKIQSFVKPSGK